MGPGAGGEPATNKVGRNGVILRESFVNANIGTAVGRDGTILRTIDGGVTWIIQLSGTKSALTDVSFANANVGTVTSDNGAVFETTDGGRSWRARSRKKTTDADESSPSPIALWITRFSVTSPSSESPAGVAASPDGTRLFVAGGSNGWGTADDWAIVGYDAASGKQLWVTRYDGPSSGYDNPQASPVVSPDGSRVYVIGDMGIGGTAIGFRTAAYDAATGHELWAATYQGPAQMSDAPRELVLSPDGSRLFVTGWSEYPDPIFRKYVTIAYDTANGSQLWVTEYHGPGTGGDSHVVAVSPNGQRLFVTGVSTGVNTHVDMATVAYDAKDGAELWVARYNGPGNYQDEGQALGISSDGSRVFVTGESASGADVSSFDYATIAYDANDGSQLWVERYNGPWNSTEWARKLAVAKNRVFVSGVSLGTFHPLQVALATVAYDIMDGNQLWVAQYLGKDPEADLYGDPRGIGVTMQGNHLFVAGSSPFVGRSLDFVTLAYETSSGGERWVAQYSYDGPDTSMGLVVHEANVYVTGYLAIGTLIDLIGEGFGNGDYATIAYIDQIPSTPTPTPSPGAPSPTPTPTPIATTPSPTPPPIQPAQALNLSARVPIDLGDNVGIGGFIIAGSFGKVVLLRGVGSSLGAGGLTDPVIELHQPNGETIVCDNWRECPGTGNICLQFNFCPTDNLEADMLLSLDPGAYTVILRGNGTGTGLGLLEIYDLSSALMGSRLANLSMRAAVATGNDIVIAGFILANGTGDDKVVVRGLGPTLAASGLAPVLADPGLELRDNNGAMVISNNDWQDDPAQAAMLTALGLAPANELESGIVATLAPGAYTALLSGANSGNGIGLVEVYDNP